MFLLALGLALCLAGWRTISGSQTLYVEWLNPVEKRCECCHSHTDMLSYKMTFYIIHLLAHGLTCVCVFFVVVSLLVRKGISLFTAWGLISCRSC